MVKVIEGNVQAQPQKTPLIEVQEPADEDEDEEEDEEIPEGKRISRSIGYRVASCSNVWRRTGLGSLLPHLRRDWARPVHHVASALLHIVC